MNILDKLSPAPAEYHDRDRMFYHFNNLILLRTQRRFMYGGGKISRFQLDMPTTKRHIAGTMRCIMAGRKLAMHTHPLP